MSTHTALSISILLSIFIQMFAAPAYAAGADERLEVKASETQQLRTLLTNQKVEAVLADGTRIRGRVRDVETGMLVINVDSSSGVSAYPRGEQRIAIDRFNTLEINSYIGRKRGILATTFGAVGLLVGLAIGSAEIDSLGGEGEINGAGKAVIAATTAGGIAAGYALGRSLDKKTITIVILR
jgi:hypothetical protein